MTTLPAAASVRQYRENGLVTLDLSWFREADGSQTWALLDAKAGHAQFTSERAALEEWDRRVECLKAAGGRG